MTKVPWGRETMAGLAGAIGSVPDGMATAVLAGANPMAGLYASFAGPVALPDDPAEGAVQGQ